VPLWQVSSPLQASPSVHEVPSVTGAFTQPVPASQESSVQELLSLQSGAVPALQVPLRQISSPLQASPSVQEVPSVTGAFTQPVPVSQESLVQGLLSLQLGAVPASHDPLWQVSTPLQASPS